MEYTPHQLWPKRIVMLTMINHRILGYYKYNIYVYTLIILDNQWVTKSNQENMGFNRHIVGLSEQTVEHQSIIPVGNVAWFNLDYNNSSLRWAGVIRTDLSKHSHMYIYIYTAQRLVVPPSPPRWWWSLYVYIHTYIHTYIHMYIYIYLLTVYIYIRAYCMQCSMCMCKCMQYVYVCLYAYVYVSFPPLNVMGRVGPYIYIYLFIYIIYIHIHTYTYIYIHIHTYGYIYIHIHTYTYIYIHTCVWIA